MNLSKIFCNLTQDLLEHKTKGGCQPSMLLHELLKSGVRIDCALYLRNFSSPQNNLERNLKGHSELDDNNHGNILRQAYLNIYFV